MTTTTLAHTMRPTWYPINAPVSGAPYGLHVDGDSLTEWSAIDGTNQLPHMSITGQTTLWEKVSA